MIELPGWAVPNGATPALVDFGGVLRPPTGAKLLRVNRQGNRFRIAITFPPMPSVDKGRILVSRLLRAKREGLRIEYPLLSVDQGAPGAVVVDGAGQAGVTLAVRGGTPHYAALEGYWLSIVDADGQHYLHNLAAQALLDASGAGELTIEPMLREPFADGATVHLARPMIEGLVDGDELQWQLALDHNLGIACGIEEAA